jgi:glycosyltransferase involved in cell wall biosynthesis
MPKVLILTLHRPQRSPSQRFRFEQYLDYLTANGFQFEWSYLLGEEDDRNFCKSGNIKAKLKILFKSTFKRLREIVRPGDYDLVFVQRECFMLGTSVFEKFFSKKAKLIFDFDDAIWLPNVSKANKKFAFLKNPRKTKDILKHASLVFAGNQYLANYAKEFCDNVEVIPTTIDTKRHHKRIKEHKKKDQLTIGWTGTNTTLKYLNLIQPALKALSRNYNFQLRVICDKPPTLDLENVKFVPWQLNSEIIDLLEFDIGIMPLTENKWSEGKCGFKILQYMALGIPTVATPIGVNADIIEHGKNGFLASSQKEWINYLKRLLQSVSLRKELGANGRKRVELNYSVDKYESHYLNAFERLLEK